MSDASTTAPAGGGTRLAVDVSRFPGVRPLAADYALRFARLSSFYAGDPQSPDAWRATADRVRAAYRNRAAAVSCLAAQQDRRGAPPASRSAVERLAHPAALAVVTGQQAGAFGGPLYTLLKAIGALQLARRAEALVGAPVVPVFWVDAEDHDWEEVASCTVLDGELHPRTVTLAPLRGAGELPVADLRLDERVADSVAALGELVPRTEFTASLVDSLGAAYAPGAGMAEAFARWLEGLLGPHGLVVMDSADPALKPLAASVFRTELDAPGTTSSLARRAGEALAALGHPPQVVPQPDGVALFHLDGRRLPIRRQGDGFLVGDAPGTSAALAEEAAAHPERFSPNVLLRPIVQDTLLPTVCYVAGPSEIAYIGQLKDVYEHFGVAMPLVHPRATATLVDSATARFLTKYDVPLEDLQPQDESRLNQLLAAQLPPTVEEALRDAGDAIARAMQRVIDVLPGVDPTLAGAARTTLGKMEHERRSLHGKLIQAVKKRDETLRRQFTRAQAQTFPNGQPQERVLSGVHFLNLYGPGLVDRLIEDLPLDTGVHWVMTV